MTTLFDSVTRIARHEAAARPAVAIGVVRDVFDSSSEPVTHAVTVELRESGIILPEVPIAVGVLGAAATPRPGDLVVVVFAEADLQGAVVVGRLYHSELASPQHSAGDIVLRLPAGEQEPGLDLVIRGGDPSVRLALGEGIEVVIDDGRVRIAAGEASALVEATGGGRVELIAGEAKIVATGRGDVEITAAGTLSIRANVVKIEGDSSVSIKAPKVEVN
jgi:phage baseplate assembly protein gpV